MSAIHELRADYRHYRLDRPQYRWLFAVGDVFIGLLKLALFLGFLIGCWFLVTGGSVPSFANASVAPQMQQKATAVELTAEPVPALTAERIALLKKIAGQLGSTSLATDSADVNSSEAASSEPELTEVQQANASSSQVETESLKRFRASLNSIAPQVAAKDLTKQLIIDPIDEVTESLKTDGDNQLADTPEDDQVPPRVKVAAIGADVVSQSVVSAGQAAVRPQTKPQQTISQKAGTRGRDWLLDQDSDHYTLQIAMTHNLPFLMSFADKLPEEYVAAIYPERRSSSGNVQYSLSLGSFASTVSAEKALASIAETHRRYGAHLRRFDEIQDNLSRFSANVDQ